MPRNCHPMSIYKQSIPIHFQRRMKFVAVACLILTPLVFARSIENVLDEKRSLEIDYQKRSAVVDTEIVNSKRDAKEFELNAAVGEVSRPWTMYAEAAEKYALLSHLFRYDDLNLREYICGSPIKDVENAVSGSQELYDGWSDFAALLMDLGYTAREMFCSIFDENKTSDIYHLPEELYKMAFQKFVVLHDKFISKNLVGLENYLCLRREFCHNSMFPRNVKGQIDYWHPELTRQACDFMNFVKQKIEMSAEEIFCPSFPDFTGENSYSFKPDCGRL